MNTTTTKTIEVLKVGIHDCVVSSIYATDIYKDDLSKVLSKLNLTNDDIDLTDEDAKAYELEAYKWLGDIGDALRKKYDGYIFDLEEKYNYISVSITRKYSI